mmetsp:Transcript_25728/g.38011  ORF Transcript_25728/g.38011 Transcript_25728/m.38011 type:complete len:85 (-) Transcript_25728:1459-1713(-)
MCVSSSRNSCSLLMGIIAGFFFNATTITACLLLDQSNRFVSHADVLSISYGRKIVFISSSNPKSVLRQGFEEEILEYVEWEVLQ